jgi:hypothetical protein
MKRTLYIFLACVGLFCSSGISAQTLFPIQWTSAVGVTVNADKSLTKVGATGWTSGAASTNLLPAGVDGQVQLTWSATAGIYMLGLSRTDKDVNYTSIEYAIYLNQGTIYVFQSGTQVGTGTYGTASPGDIFKVMRTGNVIYYYRNTTELTHTTLPNTYNSTYLADVSIYSGTMPAVQASFDVALKIDATVTPVVYGGSGGGISVTASQGTGTYTYAWSSGETTSSITNKPAGTYTVTVTDAQGHHSSKDISVGYRSAWMEVSSQLTVGTDNSLTKAGVNAWDAGAVSTNMLAENADGWIEFTWTNALAYMIGLSRRDVDVTIANIEYAFYIVNGDINIYETNNQRGVFGRAVVGDVFRIVKTGANINYYHNGYLLRSIAYATPDAKFMVDVSVATPGAVMPPVYTSFEPKIVLGRTIKPAESLTKGGDVTITPIGGIAPYTYSWDTGATGNQITNKPAGVYQVTVTDAEGRNVVKQISLGYATDWTQVSPRLQVQADNSLSDFLTGVWNAGASSINVLPSLQNGWIEFEVTKTDLSSYCIGLTAQDVDQGTSNIMANFIVARNTAVMYAAQKDVLKLQLGLTRKGDVYKIERNGGNILFYQNGTQMYSLAQSAAYPLVVDVSMSQGVTPVVYSSFDTRLTITPSITPVGVNGDGGAISLNIDGGKPPYALSWSTGETGMVLSGKPAGQVTAMVTDAAGRTLTRTYTIGNAAKWTSMTNMTRDVNYTLRKTGTTNASNAGAFSRNAIPAGQDGSMEFVYRPVACTYLLGLSSVNTSVTGSDTEYAFNFGYGTGQILIYEKSAQIPVLDVNNNPLFALPGEVFTIKRVGLTIQYLINGVTVRTKAITTSKALYADVSVYTASGAVPASIGDFADGAPITIDQKIRNNWAFEYRYDGRNRTTAKKAPGADWIYMVYDSLDRLVLTQDGNQRATNEWMFTKYDVLNRPVITGIYKHPGDQATQEAMQDFVNKQYSDSRVDPNFYLRYYEDYDGTVANRGYTNRVFPTTGITPLTVTYYDDYRFKALYNDPRYDFVADHLGGQSTTIFDRVKGQVTGTQIRSLNDAVTWMQSVNYYDDKYHVIQRVEEDHQGKISRHTSTYDFTGKPITLNDTQGQAYDVVWSVAGCLIDDADNKLICTGASWTGGGASWQALPASQDGWVEHVFDGLSMNAVGLSDTKASQSYTTIDFAAYITSNGKLYAMSNGALRGFLGDIRASDVIRVERIAGYIYIRVNGTVMYTFSSVSTTPLLVDVSLGSGTLQKVRTSFGADKSQSTALRWGYASGLTISGTTLTRSTATNAWTGYAATLNVLSGDGAVQFKALETNTNRMAGLSSFVPLRDYNDLEYAIYLQPTVGSSNPFTIREGTQTIYTGSYVAGDIFRIERTNTQVKYYKNNFELVPTLPSQPATKAYRFQVAMYTKSSTIAEVSVTFGIPMTEQKTDLFTRLDYDRSGRVMKEWHKTNDAPEILLTTNEYNELGQLITKRLYNTDTYGASDATRQYKQDVDYRYNIRGWLTRINHSDLSGSSGPSKDLFGMELAYDQPLAGLSSTQAYNGNISAMRWSNNLGYGGINNPSQRAYRYEYDNMNRLSSAQHFTQTGLWAPANAFDEIITGYDQNGNILGLQRTGKDHITIDNLTYSYGADMQRSNKLLSVTGASSDTDAGFKDGTNTALDYSYDDNGNMVSDLNKDIQSINYNHLNLPARVNKTSGEYIKYIYDATGRKLAQQVFNANNAMVKRSDYVGNLFLQNDTLKFVNHSEGRIIPAATRTAASEYQYNLKDHLGNVRLTFTTKDETETTVATLEPSHENEDRAKYLYYDEAVKVKHYWFDHTNNIADVPERVCTGLGTVDGYATRLTGGSTDARFGLAQSISVMPGDVVNMEVWAKYVDLSQEAPGTPIVNFISTLGTAASIATGTFIDGGAPGSLGDLPMLINPIPHLVDDPDNVAPKAYLNFVFMDRDMHESSTDLGYSQITTDAIEHGQNGCHQKLSLSYEVKQPGYLYIYLSNENPTEVEVFFDDFKVEHVKSPVVQMDDYYPFGAELNSFRREHGVRNQYKFNSGSELQNDLGVEVYLTDYRVYDQWGRMGWWQMDPKVDDLYDFSPYNFSFNNPVLHNDKRGDCPPGTLNCADYDNDIVANAPLADLLSVKHSAYNLVFSLFGSSKRAAFVENSDGYETGVVETEYTILQDNTYFALDLLNVVTFGQTHVTGFLAKAPLKSAAINSAKKAINKSFETYTKPSLKGGPPYVGRTSGKGTPAQNVARRDANHHMTKKGYGKAILDRTAKKPEPIRGREELLIKKNGGAKSQGGTSANEISGISATNPRKAEYIEAAKVEWRRR